METGSHRKSQLDMTKEMLQPLRDIWLHVQSQQKETRDEANKEQHCPSKHSFPESASLYSRERSEPLSYVFIIYQEVKIAFLGSRYPKLLKSL